MSLDIDITLIIVQLINLFISFIRSWYISWDNIIIFNGSLVGADFDVTVLDFFIGITVTGIVLGAFLRISKADKFYGDR